MRRLFCILFVFLLPVISWSYAKTSGSSKEIGKTFYLIKLHRDIDKSAVRTVTNGLDEAVAIGADYCIIDMNTYGGAVDAADSIRSAILKSPVPVISFINIQAISAGALISIACDSIYMNIGSSIGAATVVNGQGEVMPDKYQSFMRAMMRSTAESHGKKYDLDADGDTILVWRRDPALAQAMVSRDSVLSFTPDEAVENGYCEGIAERVEDVALFVMNGSMLDYDGVTGYEIIPQKETFLDKIINFLLTPLLQSLLLMLIIGGIYFEMQSPGIGFPLAVSVIGAVLYFAPLYIEGLVQNWEIALFIAGVLLMAIEIFVLPGFGIAGIGGVILMITGLAFAMIDNDLLVIEEGTFTVKPLIKPFAIVLLSMTLSLFGSIYLAARLYGTEMFSRIALKTDLSSGKGYVGVETDSIQRLVGCKATISTDLKPSGTVEIDGKRYYAQINCGFAEKGEEVYVIKVEEGRLYCKKC